MAAHRYWRVYVTEYLNSDWFALAIVKLEFRVTVGGADQSTQLTAIQDPLGAGSAAYAFDDDVETQWEAYTSIGGSLKPTWIGQDFGSGNEKDIVEIAVQVSDLRQPEDFELQYSDDGSAWVTALSITGEVDWAEFEVRTYSVALPNSAPTITSNGGDATASISYLENSTDLVTTVTATDADSDTITFSISGVDAAQFTINATTGALSFIAPPDYESPTDSLGVNEYYINVVASDDLGSSSQALTVTVLKRDKATSWTTIIKLDGVDVSDRITGEIRVEAEEKTSRVASFYYHPPSGVINAGDWLGVSVSINYKTVSSLGVELSNDRLFTGIVDQALYDPITQLTAFDCTDDMQGKLEAMTQAEVDTLIVNSRYSEAVFNEFKDGWLHFENVMSTYPQSYDFNVDGVTGTLVDWKAKVTPDFDYDSSTIIDDSISYSISPRRDLFNSYTIDYSYRFTRLHHRSHNFSWGVGFCTYFGQSHELPTKEAVRSAAGGAGWKATSVSIASLPPNAADPCYVGVSWGVSDEVRDLLAIGATWVASKRWDQEVTENYTLTVSAPQSVSWLGEVAYSEQASNKTEFDASGWADGADIPTGRVNSLGDTVQDKFDRTSSNNDIETLIARARTEILDSHRANHVVATVLLNPEIERFHTVKLDADGVTGQGKVFKLVHELDTDTGQATTTIDIAISLNGGGAEITDTAIEAPAAPGSDPASTPPSNTTLLPTYIGGTDTAADFDPGWQGFTGNYSTTVGFPTPEQFYPRAFKVVTPAINQDSIDHVESVKSKGYLFDIPNELLTIMVG